MKTFHNLFCLDSDVGGTTKHISLVVKVDANEPRPAATDEGISYFHVHLEKQPILTHTVPQ